MTSASEGPRLPPRPAIPLVLWACGAVLASERAVLAAAHAGEGCLPDGWTAAALAVGALLAALLCLQLRRGGHAWLRASLVVLVAASMGCASAGALSRRLSAARSALQTSAMSSWTFVTSTDATRTERGFRCRAHACRDGRIRADVWLSTNEPVGRGSALACVGRFHPLSDDGYGRSSWAQGICGSVSVVRVRAREPPQGLGALITELRGRVLDSLDPAASDGRALVAGCVCASRDALSQRGLDDLFATCGLSHLIAVSGAHLAIVSGLLARLLARTRLRPRGRVLVQVAATGLFVLFCGAPPSAVRAWAMSLAAAGSELAGRRAHALSAVGLTALVLALADSALAGQLGFVLSVLSVAGLCLFAPHATYAVRVIVPCPRLPRRWGRRVRAVVQDAYDGATALLAATLVCQAVSLPVTARAFGRISLVAPVANLGAAPLVALVMPLGLLACLVGQVPLLGQLPLAACEALCCPLVGMLLTLARMPLAAPRVSATGVLPSLALAFALVLWLAWWPRMSRRRVVAAGCALAGLACVMLLRWRLFAPPRVLVLDVGQGDAILVQDGAAAVLVDAGPDEAVAEALVRRHVLHLDALVLTHLHDDHYGGIAHLAGTVGCDHVLVARGVAAAMDESLRSACVELTGGGVEELAYGDVVRVGHFALRVVWPREVVDGSENAHSIELVGTYAQGDACLTCLLTGDAERDETGACLAAGDVGDIDLLKVGHHGSAVSLTPQEAEALAAELAVASAGEGNRYGHPTPACRSMLEAAGALFLCTKDVGDVEVRPGRDGPVVRTYGTESPVIADAS